MVVRVPGSLSSLAHPAALDDVLPAEPLVVGPLAAPEDLGAQDHVRPLPAQLLCSR